MRAGLCVASVSGPCRFTLEGDAGDDSLSLVVGLITTFRTQAHVNRKAARRDSSFSKDESFVS